MASLSSIPDPTSATTQELEAFATEQLLELQSRYRSSDHEFNTGDIGEAEHDKIQRFKERLKSVLDERENVLSSPQSKVCRQLCAKHHMSQKDLEKSDMWQLVLDAA